MTDLGSILLREDSELWCPAGERQTRKARPRGCPGAEGGETASVAVNTQAQWAELPLWLGSAILSDFLSPQRQLSVPGTQKGDMLGWPAPHQGNPETTRKFSRASKERDPNSGELSGATQAKSWELGRARQTGGDSMEAKGPEGSALPCPTCQEESWGWGGRGEKEAHGCDYLIIPSLEDGETEAGG